MATIAVTAGNAKADFVFGEAVHLGTRLNTSSNDGQPCVSTNGLELYFQSDRPSGQGKGDIWLCTRASIDDNWGGPVNIGPTVNSSAGESEPYTSANGLELFFSSDRSGGVGGVDLYVATRTTIQHAWREPVNLGGQVNMWSADYGASLSGDGLTLYFDSNRSGGSGKSDIWVTTRATLDDPWAEVMNLGSTVNTGAQEISPCISADGRWLCFRSWKSGGQGNCDLWLSTRAAPSDPWSDPVNLGPPVNSSSCEHDPSFSADGRTIFFASNDRPGGLGGDDLWQISIHPIVDFNGNGQIGIGDLTTLIEKWGQNEPSLDIGPMPWGDGVVDAADLEVLMSYWGQKAYDRHLLAHWMLDETEGDVAYDSAVQNDAVVSGDATWAPEGGTIAGALSFDGMDDYIQAPRILNPADDVFSVFAWIKGGVPGQAIISQENGVNWLMANTEGALSTDISDPITQTRQGTGGGLPLTSLALITDGNWHRVGFVWDGSSRILYVDDVVVAEDTLSNLAGASGGLRIGTGSDLEAGTFWSGLIDDVRIHDRVVAPSGQ